MKGFLAVVFLLMPARTFAADYKLRQEGDFSPAGYRVELYDRYGWSAYRVDFDFGLDQASRTLSRGSKLTLTLERRSGRWSYTCKAKRDGELSANVNFLYGTGIAVVASCRLPPKKFAKAVDLEWEDVGQPVLVFEAVINEGQVSAGAQRGLYFIGVPESSDLSSYASSPDAASLAVLFH